MAGVRVKVRVRVRVEGLVVLQVARRDVAEREGGRRLDLLRQRAEAGHHGVEQRRVAAQVVRAADLALVRVRLGLD